MKQPLIFGEVLFDNFPDGRNVLGGAPFNVAWNLQGFGLSPLMLTRIGTDSAAEKVLAAMEEWRLSQTGVQRDSSRPTGVVNVKMDGRHHTFEIAPDQAYDYIDLEQAETALAGHEPGLLYHGTLALRNDISRRSLEMLREKTALPIFLDLNLRAPWYDEATLPQLVNAARWLKLNDDELAILDGSARQPDNLVDAAKRLLAQDGPELIIVTRADKGAFLLSRDGSFHEAQPETPERFMDTVGAGDAFSAVAIAGLLLGWPLETLLARAVKFASAIVGIRGATSEDPSLYRAFATKWGVPHGSG